MIANVVKNKIKQWTNTGNPDIRDAWVARKIQELKPGSRVLDAGAGERRLKPLCSHLHYVSQDFGQYDGAGDATGLHMGSWNNAGLDIVSDITSIPEPDGAFDGVLCIEVIEHVPAPIDAIRELARLLRTGGDLILTSPFASLTHFAPFHFYSGFNRYFYTKWLDEFGLNVVEITPYGNFFDYLRQETLRLRGMASRYAGNARLGVLDYLALFRIMRTLKRLSACDAGSSELLCYGYMVHAVKR